MALRESPYPLGCQPESGLDELVGHEMAKIFSSLINFPYGDWSCAVPCNRAFPKWLFGSPKVTVTSALINSQILIGLRPLGMSTLTTALALLTSSIKAASVRDFPAKNLFIRASTITRACISANLNNVIACHLNQNDLAFMFWSDHNLSGTPEIPGLAKRKTWLPSPHR